jgi:hypothetical protein
MENKYFSNELCFFPIYILTPLGNRAHFRSSAVRAGELKTINMMSADPMLRFVSAQTERGKNAAAGSYMPLRAKKN